MTAIRTNSVRVRVGPAAAIVMLRSAAWLAGLLFATRGLPAQTTAAEVAAERTAYLEWLRTAPNSPLAAVAQQRIGEGLRIGPADADIPLPGVPELRVSDRHGAVRLEGAGAPRVVPAGRPLALGGYHISAGGPPDARVVSIFADTAGRKLPTHYPYDPRLVFEGPLAPAESRGPTRVLAVDGVETEAAESGTVTVTVGGRRVRLRVRRIPSGSEESDLEIFFRDGTNGAGSYPAGRFVSLIPVGGDRYRLDFNRARNPFCAYSTAYPCPAPWAGNTIPAPVAAGERYSGGGREVAAPQAQPGEDK